MGLAGVGGKTDGAGMSRLLFGGGTEMLGNVGVEGAMCLTDLFLPLFDPSIDTGCCFG